MKHPAHSLPSFDRLADFERTRDDLRNYIISSMVYPCLLALVGASSIAFLLTFVVPRFASVFQESHMKMPLPTMLMLESSKMLQQYGWMVLIAIGVAIVVTQAAIRTDSGRLWWHGFQLRIPVLGDALRKAEVARFARAMSTLVVNSVPLVQSLQFRVRLSKTNGLPAHSESSPRVSAEAKDWLRLFAEQANFRRSPRTCSALAKKLDGWMRCLPEWPKSTKPIPAPRSGASRPSSNRS